MIMAFAVLMLSLKVYQKMRKLKGVKNETNLGLLLQCIVSTTFYFIFAIVYLYSGIILLRFRGVALILECFGIVVLTINHFGSILFLLVIR